MLQVTNNPPNSTSPLSGPRPVRKSRLRRQPRAPVPTHMIPLKKNVLVVWLSAVCCLICFSAVPIWILESMQDPEHHPRAVHGVHRLINVAQVIGDKAKALRTTARNVAFPTRSDQREKDRSVDDTKNFAPVKSEPTLSHQVFKEESKDVQHSGTLSVTEQQGKPQYKVSDLPSDPVDWRQKTVARSIAGRPLAQTPAVVGASRAHVDCEIGMDSLVYWNDPVGKRDLEFKSPFAATNQQYISFTPDSGGWNNVRMSMEILFVLAAVTGRTLVLPPKEPLYLLNNDREKRHRGFADFFPLNNPNFPVKLISMEDFLKLPSNEALLNEKDDIDREKILNAADHCDKRKGSSAFCGPVYDFLGEIGHNPGFCAYETCVIFDEDAVKDPQFASEEAKVIAEKYCGEKRKVTYWNSEDHARYDHLHFPSQNKDYRLLTHFYNMIYFSNASIGNFYKRFVRDYLHYNDVIYCAAGKIVKALQKEGIALGFSLDAEGGGAYSALHVRRGDLQYKRVKIPANEWYNNTKELWLDNEILYVATDERNKTFFDDLAVHYQLRFLDDYWEMAGLSNLDPNFMGMIDTVVASRGRVFVGTWFSTFSGYINRLRGYHGMSMKDSWYSFLPKKEAMQDWNVVARSAYAFEWPDGWIGIDGDVEPNRDIF